MAGAGDQGENGSRTGWWIAGGLLAGAGILGPLLGLLIVTMLVITMVAAAADEGPSEEGHSEIPTQAYEAYWSAAQQAEEIAPGCTGLHWSVLAGIGRVESGHANGATIADNGDVDPWILGPRLDGSGAGGNTIPIYDTDEGRWDTDTEYDRAVGPMQFIPSSWELFGQDGNGDGQRDPHNLYDAALASAAHLCGTGTVDLADEEQLRQAIYGYNRSWAYVDEVLMWAARYTATADVGDTPITPGGPGPGPWGGHTNGNIPASELCALPWPTYTGRTEQLRCDATTGLTQLNKAYRAEFGTNIVINDSYRSYARQVELKNWWCARGACHMAAEPGTSNHGWALAVDLGGGIGAWGTREQEWMRRNAPQYNWHNPPWAQPGNGKEEPWHWEWGQ